MVGEPISDWDLAFYRRKIDESRPIGTLGARYLLREVDRLRAENDWLRNGWHDDLVALRGVVAENESLRASLARHWEGQP